MIQILHMSTVDVDVDADVEAVVDGGGGGERGWFCQSDIVTG
jgi:hypothetical protein